MGTTTSRHGDPTNNEYLNQFYGQDPIPSDHPFWNKFLSFSISPPTTCSDHRNLDAKLRPCCEVLAVNNLKTGNFSSLIKVFLQRTRELLANVESDVNQLCTQIYNALFIIRCFTKYLVETYNEEEILQQFESKQTSQTGMYYIDLAPVSIPFVTEFIIIIVVVIGSVDSDVNSSNLDSFLDALIEIVVDVPLKDYTYILHLEAINCILVLLSIQMFSTQPAEKLCVYRSLMQGRNSIHSPLLVRTLLQHFINQTKVPPGVLNGDGQGGSIVLGLASGLWSIVTLGYGRSNETDELLMAIEAAATPEERQKAREALHSRAPLAGQALLLLLVLVNHCTSDKGPLRNPYRQALFSFTAAHKDDDAVASAPTKAASTFKLDTGALYGALCHVPNSDQTTLLLYMLLHRNQQFRTYVISRSDIEQLLVPILRTLYHAPDSNSHHIYMSLIVILILSEDDLFTKTVHDVMLKGASWYTERAVSEISLGGLLILVIIRSIQYNISKMRDKYLHSNCLAALANMSGQFRCLHPYVSQRLVSLFETLARKYVRLEERIKNSQSLPKPNSPPVDTKVNAEGQVSSVEKKEGHPPTESTEGPSGEIAPDLAQDLTVLQEVLRMVLEIINSGLSHQLQHNPNLLYTLLYKRSAFEPFRTHPAFEDIINNIDAVINYFTSKLEHENSDLGENEVLATIQRGALQWPRERLKKFPDLKFKYVEEDKPEEFFIPYVWSLVVHSSGIYWSANNMKMFVADSDVLAH
ncbi:dymeclin isoform X2 [Thrips palmi]|uniref:Dymeclin n=1 Tax=Thrips palmi TaxID=161013 RepID=A0A6P8Z6S3_THRPL|nr:dymeclin isoform X2 [Thrips palmi]